MKALVTGASGFIGSTLIGELGDRGWEVRALMRRSSSPANLEGLRYERVDGDLGDEPSLRAAVKGVDFVFHLAGVTAAPTREAYFERNGEGTRRVVQAVAAENPGLKRFIYVSSLAAGGPAGGLRPRRESDEPAPVSSYGESKLAGEKAVLALRERIPVAIVRPPLVYGPRDKGIFLLIRTVERRLMPILRGGGPGGLKYYSTVHARDLCRGLLKVADADASQVPSGEIFYICSNEISTYQDILATAARHLGRRPLKFRVPQSAIRWAAHGLTALGSLTGRSFLLNRDKLNELLPDFWICSNQKAHDRLGFTPEYELGPGLGQSIAWYKEHGWL